MSVLDGLRPEDVGAGPLLCNPSSRLTRPFVAMPDADVVVIFGLLRFAAPEPALVDALVTRNRVVLTPGNTSFRVAIRPNIAHRVRAIRSGLPIELARGAVLCFARASAHEMAS